MSNFIWEQIHFSPQEKKLRTNSNKQIYAYPVYNLRKQRKTFKVIFQEICATRKLKKFEGKRILKIEGI